MANAKKKGLTREEATKLYETLKKRMESKHGKAGLQKLINEEKKKQSRQGRAPQLGSGGAGLRAYQNSTQQHSLATQSNNFSVTSKLNGQRSAILLVLLCAGFKLTLSLMEFSGVFEVKEANASLNTQAIMAYQNRPKFSKDEVAILKSLDARRVELEKRKEKLEVEENRFKKMDREYAARLTELRTINQKLKEDRAKSNRQQDAKLDQLANVYGSMNPKNAAELIEQLDIEIAKRLIERMPEKRMAQILAMMSPDRALTITRMLSGE
jgi:flagellar motility protein MotE (MotC chaperone)